MTNDLVEILHDRIDHREEFAEKAALKVDEVISKALPKLAREGANFNEIFNTLAAIVAKEISGLTTQAVRKGAESAKRTMLAE